VSFDDRAVLRGHWKLLVSVNTLELYNLDQDPFERIDRSRDSPVLIEQMQSVIGNIPQRDSINQPLYKIMMDTDSFGGEEDRPPWAAVVR
jgi:hypothetical protein